MSGGVRSTCEVCEREKGRRTEAGGWVEKMGGRDKEVACPHAEALLVIDPI